MRLLLDECLPKDLAHELPGHGVKTVPQVGWASISNGKRLVHILPFTPEILRRLAAFRPANVDAFSQPD